MHIAHIGILVVCFNFWFGSKQLPAMREVSGEFFVFQRDKRLGTPGTRHCTTSRATPAFIPPDLWPANSPNLNPVDYRICSVVRQRVYQRVYQSQVHDTEELKQRLHQVWRNVDQSIVDNTIDKWRKRIRKCVQENGE